MGLKLKSIKKQGVINLLDHVYDKGYCGIGYVGAANYASREAHAKSELSKAHDETMKQLRINGWK